MKKCPAFFGKDEKRLQLINHLPEEFVKIQRQYKIPQGDIPDVKKYQEILRESDFSKFPKLNARMIEQMDEVLSVDLTALLAKFPPDHDAQFLHNKPEEVQGEWKTISKEERTQSEQIFKNAKPIDSKLTGPLAKPLLLATGLENDLLKRIWYLSDLDKDGELDLDEFVIAMHLAHKSQKGVPLPGSLPVVLIPTSKLSTPF